MLSKQQKTGNKEMEFRRHNTIHVNIHEGASLIIKFIVKTFNGKAIISALLK